MHKPHLNSLQSALPFRLPERGHWPLPIPRWTLYLRIQTHENLNWNSCLCRLRLQILDHIIKNEEFSRNHLSHQLANNSRGSYTNKSCNIMASHRKWWHFVDTNGDVECTSVVARGHFRQTRQRVNRQLVTRTPTDWLLACTVVLLLHPRAPCEPRRAWPDLAPS